MSTLLVVLLPLVEKGPDPDDVKPGWLGFGMFLALAVAVTLLWLSMRRQLKKIDFEEEPDAPPTAGGPATGADDATAQPNGTGNGGTGNGPARDS
jgi:hypothetical protein